MKSKSLFDLRMEVGCKEERGLYGVVNRFHKCIDAASGEVIIYCPFKERIMDPEEIFEFFRFDPMTTNFIDYDLQFLAFMLNEETMPQEPPLGLIEEVLKRVIKQHKQALKWQATCFKEYREKSNDR